MGSEIGRSSQSKRQSGVTKILRFREFGIGTMVIIVFVLASIVQPRFLSYENILSIMLYLPLIVVVAMGEMMVVVSRNFDLSVGSILGFSGIVVGMIFIKHPGFPIWLAFVLGTLIGSVLGAVNGFLIVWLRLPAIIVTLGTLNIYRGSLFIISGGRQIDPNYIPASLIRLSETSPLIIPWIIIFAAIIAVLTAGFLRFSHTGREIYAIGSNPLAASLRGINVKFVVLLVFMLSGGLAGFAGIMYASRFGYVNPGMTGVGFEFVVIAATIIGGTSVDGGSGSVIGTVLGALLLGIINTALAVVGISGSWQQAIYGAIIVIALISDKTIQTRLTNTLKRGVRA